jgi:hypothetical protein
VLIYVLGYFLWILKPNKKEMSMEEKFINFKGRGRQPLSIGISKGK